MVAVILKLFADTLATTHLRSPRRITSIRGELFRVDAKAADNCVVVGGWETGPRPRQGAARWFACRLTKQSAPWAFARGEPFRVVASLELLAVLVGVIAFDVQADDAVAGHTRITAYTDNQGNGYLLDRMMTTKLPLGIFLVELAAQLEKRRTELSLEWVPREQNEEADALANEDVRGFDPALRVPVKLENLGFLHLPGLLDFHEAFRKELEALREQRRAAAPRAALLPRKRKGARSNIRNGFR